MAASSGYVLPSENDLILMVGCLFCSQLYVNDVKSCIKNEIPELYTIQDKLSKVFNFWHWNWMHIFLFKEEIVSLLEHVNATVCANFLKYFELISQRKSVTV